MKLIDALKHQYGVILEMECEDYIRGKIDITPLESSDGETRIKLQHCIFPERIVETSVPRHFTSMWGGTEAFAALAYFVGAFPKR